MVKSSVAEFEAEVLRALLDPSFYARWGRNLPLSLFSPHGQKLARAVIWCHQANQTNKRQAITLPDIMASLKREKNTSRQIFDLAKTLVVRGLPNPTIQQALAAEAIQRTALEELVRQAIVQQSTGKINLDALRTALRMGRPSGFHTSFKFDPKAIVGETGKLSPVPTPWAAINREIEGGLFPKELGMVLASPKVGKTTMLLNLAVEALDRAFYTLYITVADQGYSDIARRLAGVWLDCPASSLRNDPATLDAAKKGWEARGGMLAIADYASRPCRMGDVERDIEVAQEDCDKRQVVVFLDRLERATMAGNDADMRWGVLAVYEEARRLAHKYAVPIWCDSQASLSQTRKDGRPTDEGWVSITRGAEARVFKAMTVDLCLGTGVHPDDETIIRLNVEGRREIVQHRHELRRNPKSGVISE